MTKNTDPLLTEREAADYLRISVYWLQKVRSQGRPGPAITSIGRAVRYRRSALDRYIEENTGEETSFARTRRDGWPVCFPARDEAQTSLEATSSSDCRAVRHRP